MNFGENGKWRIARKEHSCCDYRAKNQNGTPYNPNCLQIIKVGQVYYDTNESSQRPFATLKWCLNCANKAGYFGSSIKAKILKKGDFKCVLTALTN